MKSAKNVPVQIQFVVTVNVERIEDQTMQEFLKEDLPAITPYLAEKLKHSMQEAWQFNAKVSKVKISRI